jgi:hypothetical protein
MKLFTLLAGLLLCVCFAHAGTPFAAPTLPATNFSASGSDGDKINLTWTNGNGQKRIVIARKDGPVTALPVNGVNYIANASYGAGNEIQTGQFVVYNGSGNAMTVNGLQAATTYHFAVFEYNGTGAAIEYLASGTLVNGSTYLAPTGQVASVVSDQLTGHSVRLSWTTAGVSGLGQGRLVLAREGAPVNVNPTDLSTYAANLNFGSGTQIGSGNYVVYKNSGNSFTIDDLKPNTTYHFAIFEYNGSSGLVFNIANPPSVSIQTLPRPALPASALAFSNVEGSTLSVTITKGSGARRIVVGRAGAPVTAQPADGTSYTANNAFGAGQEIEPGQFVVFNGIGNNFSLTGLQPSTTYHFAVYEYDGTGGFSAYLVNPFLAASQATVSAPQTAASGLSVSGITNSGASFSWTSGNGVKRVVILRRSDVTDVPPSNLTSYGASSTFGLGAFTGVGNYSIYNNNGNTATVSGLASGTNYTATVYEYNGSSAPVYLFANAPTISFTTSLAPTNAATALTYSNIEGTKLSVGWTNGNGTRRIVVARQGAPVTAIPQDGASYTANAAFGSGSELAPGQFVVFNGPSNSQTVTNLLPSTTYYFAVFEFNTVNNQTYYLAANPAAGQSATATAPTVNASSLVFSNVTGNKLTMSFVRGNGTGRVVLMRAGSPVNAVPQDLLDYNYSTQFGQGAQIGSGNYVVYAGNSNILNISGLLPGVNYHVKIFEYNGSSMPVYQTNGVLEGSRQTNERPQTAASGMNFASIEGNKLTVRWTSGDGAKRILVGRQGAPVSFVPVDGQDYSANAALGAGTDLGSGQYVLFNNTQSEVAVTNLTPGTTYHFAVIEYDGSGSGTRYQSIAPLTGSSATVNAPSVSPSNVLFSSVGSSTVNVNWTNGDGARRIVVMRKNAPVNAVPVDLQNYPSSSSNYNASNTLSGDNYVVYTGPNSTVSLANLLPGTTYHFAVFEYNGFTVPVYRTSNPATGSITTLGPPSDPATSVVFTLPSATSVRINWINGTGQKRLVLVRDGGAVNALPVNNTDYVANTFFGSGQEIGSGNFVVFNGFADNVTINNLIPGHSYHVAVFEYNQFASGPVYLTTSPARGQFAGAALPVVLTRFSGRKESTGVELEWQTSEEQNTGYFGVERSSDGRSFTQIGTVQAAGSSSALRTYRFADAHIASQVFYRLRMVDADGRVAYSSVLRFDSEKGSGLQVYPTVATHSVQIAIEGRTQQAALVQVLSGSGQVLRQRSLSLPGGRSVLTEDVSALPSGTYWIRIDRGGETEVARFIRQ